MTISIWNHRKIKGSMYTDAIFAMKKFLKEKNAMKLTA